MANSKIADAGKNTRFGQLGGPDPKSARAALTVNPSSLRAALRRLMAYPVSLERPLSHQLTEERLVGFLSHGRPYATLAMLSAVIIFQEAMKDGNDMINIIDGQV